jgi:hypothetical protein
MGTPGMNDATRGRYLQVIFGLFLATGATVGVYFLWAVADWIRPQGEGALGMFLVGGVSFVPAALGWLAGGAYLFMARDRDVRLGVALTTAHIVWWLLVIGIGAWGVSSSWKWADRFAWTVEPGLYACGLMTLAARWFRQHRGRGPVQAAA